LALGAGPLPPRRALLRPLHDPADGTWLDDALVLFFAGPRSYTGEDLLELQLHGSPLLVRRVLAVLFRLGARQADPGEFTLRAFLNGKLDLQQAEALGQLIDAPSEDLAAEAGRQLHGYAGQWVDRISQELAQLAARTTAELDFPEDVPELDDAELARRAGQLAQALTEAAATFERARRAREGFRVVLCGRPNAGKSSLFNALLGHGRALVSAEPGTTRDYLEETIVVGGRSLLLTDTAGLRRAEGQAEALGVERSRERAARADLLLLLVDQSVTTDALDHVELPATDATAGLLVLTKCDLPRSPGFVPAQVGDWPCLEVSARSGQGVDQLAQTLGSLAARAQAWTPGEAPLVLSLRQRDTLLRAAADLALVRDGAGRQPLEILDSTLRRARDTLLELGLGGAEDVLDLVFKGFCIGK
jgi:tRNA modification GTPase